jgi:AcrR family transcriptional regulator
MPAAGRATPPEGVRRQRARATRRRMVEGAYRLFCQRGYAATTMRDIAAEAEVAVQTLYFTFGTKSAILGEAVGAAVVGFDRWTGAPAGPIDVDQLTGVLGWYEEFRATSDPRAALAIFVQEGTAVLDRVGPLVAALTASRADPHAAAVIDLAEQRRVDSYRDVVRTLATKGGLRRGLSDARATDVLLVLFSAEVYQALRATRGWSRVECERFLLDILTQQLLP